MSRARRLGSWGLEKLGLRSGEVEPMGSIGSRELGSWEFEESGAREAGTRGVESSRGRSIEEVGSWKVRSRSRHNSALNILQRRHAHGGILQ